ncbi:flagellar export chaperone FliS [Petropleomorpha daqingensis]|uniref:Flagellar protein FliS n=1 Tax=Petropleomorpha daqingensis TaxID=2026353 RepID=A0A853CGN5_9ACTN|nr:flagellar export chaperone FliS [Petropleomorpha daqingensis]NYJ06341.1 flagellar protein FliS [Petropleomorpha daqingensis]
MSTAALRARYLNDRVATASPQQLLVMLYDRLALDLERAEDLLVRSDRDAAREQIQHAQDIIVELHATLNVDVWEGGPRLAALYVWLIQELIQAGIKGDLRRVRDCRKVVEPLRDAWREAAASLAALPA